MDKLTQRQEEVYKTIKKFIAENGYSPSVREICELCNIKSTSTATERIHSLYAKGYIDMQECCARTIKIVQEGDCS